MNAAPVIAPRTDGPKSGILVMRNTCADFFTEWSIPAVVTPVGAKYRSFQTQSPTLGGNRVTFIPGEFDPSSAPKPRKYGKIDRASSNAASVRNPRELASWERPITIAVWSAPAPGQAQDEGMSVAVAEDLVEKVFQALAPFGASIQPGEVTIQTPPTDGAFGVELFIRLVQTGPIYDVALEYAQAIIVPTLALE